MRTMARRTTCRQEPSHGWRKEKMSMCVCVGGVVAKGGGLPKG